VERSRHLAPKLVAQKIARLLASDAGLRTAASVGLAATHGITLLQKRGWLPQARTEAPRAPADGSIGIWEPRDGADGREFVRVTGRDPWSLWADLERIGPKRCRRVVLLGESVARGFFYDPAYNVARVLQRILDSLPDLGPIEVVDLARTDMQLDGLLELMHASLALEPDAFVVCAGNNWWPFASAEHIGIFDYARLAHDLRGGIHGVVPFLQGRLAAEVSRFVTALAELVHARQLPALLVLPEFNLLDWRSDAGRHAPWLGQGRNLPWLEAREQAEAALAAGDLATTERLARAMVELDAGLSSAGPSLLAQVALRRGDAQEARQHMETAKDAEIWSPIPVTPRCFGVIQATLREEAARRSLPLVDLPRRFEQRFGGLPDRRIFHDYCHLSGEGIVVAMRATAEELSPLLGGPTPLCHTIAEGDLLPPPAVAAEACFTAAIHNAYWGQPLELVQHHCRRALELWPDLADTMLKFIDFRVRHAPVVLCRSFAELCGSPGGVVERFFASNPRTVKTFSAALLQIVAESIEASHPGSVQALEELQIQEHAVERGPIDLLRTFHACESNAEHEVDWEQERGFYKAYRDRSRFFLVRRDEETEVDLDLVLRIAEPAGRARVTLLANGVAITCVPVASRWERLGIRLPKAALRVGTNRVELVWPRETLADPHGSKRMADTLGAFRLPDFYPVLGEISRFVATPVGWADSGAG